MGSEVQSKVQDTAFARLKFWADFILSALTHGHKNLRTEPLSMKGAVTRITISIYL